MSSHIFNTIIVAISLLITLFMSWVVLVAGLGTKLNMVFGFLVVCFVGAIIWNFVQSYITIFLIVLQIFSVIAVASGWIYFVRHSPSIVTVPSEPEH